LKLATNITISDDDAFTPGYDVTRRSSKRSIT
jgi:hypothetical protein